MRRLFSNPIERREFQRLLINELRSGEAVTLDDTFLGAVEKKLHRRFAANKRAEAAAKWIDELELERILVRTGDRPNEFKLNPQPIVGETARERFENLPADVPEKRTSLSLLILYAANSFLFLWLSFFFLPDSIVKVLGSAAGVVLGVLGLKSLNPRETNSAGSSRRQRGLLVAILLMAVLVQGRFLYIGYTNPCRIWAIPGSTVFMDGKFFARTPELTEAERTPTKGLSSPNNILPWLKPRENYYYVRWDTHEIKITKRWYLDAERSQESVKNVRVNLGKLWRPNEAFSDWVMFSEQKVMFKIDYGVLKGQPAAAAPNPDSNTANPIFTESALRDLVEEWDRIWTTAMDQKDFIGHKRTEPYIAAIQMVQDRSALHLEFQIRDWTDRPLKPLRPIPEPRADSNQISDPRIFIREDVFRQLLDELGIPERITLPPGVALAQKLNTEVETSAAMPSATPTSTAGPLPIPTGTATPWASPAPTAFASASPVNVETTVKDLEKVATEAAKNNQLNVAVAAQQQLKAAISKVVTKSRSNLSLAADIKKSQEVVEKAIREQSGKGRVYIHIADESQREPARELESVINKNHFAVIGIQNVGGRAYIPDTAEVRFFAYPEPPTTKQAADEIVRILESARVSKPRSSYVIPSLRDRQESVDVTTHFEIWFARDSFPAKSRN
jgi:hypothetical protein